MMSSVVITGENRIFRRLRVSLGTLNRLWRLRLATSNRELERTVIEQVNI